MLQEHHQMTHNGMQRNPRMGIQQMGPPPNQRTPMLMSMPTTVPASGVPYGEIGVLVSMSPGAPGPALITPPSLAQQQVAQQQAKPGLPPQQPPQVYHYAATQEAAQAQQAPQSQQLPAPPSVAPPLQQQPLQQETDLSQQHGNQDPQSANCPNTSTSSAPNSTLANIKEKTPMCLVNELARYNKIQHQYRLTGETGPAHKKVFTVTLKLGSEEYEADGPSIKKAQHSAAAKALTKTELKHPPLKALRGGRPMPRPGVPPGHGHAIPPTVELNALAMKRGERTVYVVESGGTPPHQSFRANPGVVLYRQGYAGAAGYYPHPRHTLGYSAGGGAPPSRFGYEARGRGGGGGPGAGAPPPAGARPAAGPYGPPPPPYADPAAARYYAQPPFRPPAAHAQPPTDSRYAVRLRVGEREYPGHGYTIQAARHDAAAKAIEHIKQMGGVEGITVEAVASATDDQQQVEIEGPSTAVAAAGDVNADLKSPISLVYEIALKRNLNVAFDVLSEKGPPHMKLFVTQCRVGNFVADGEGNSKKISKKRAAEKMLDEMSKLPPMPVTTSYSQLRRKRITNKKKTRNLIKVNVDKNSEASEEINPISRLIQIQQANKEREPVYTVLEERGAPRRREFVIEASVNGHTVSGVGPNKKVAKRNAAEALLAELGFNSNGTPLNAPKSSPKVDKENDAASANVADKNRKVTFVEEKPEPPQQPQPSVGGSGGRQLVPGVLLVTEQTAGFSKPKSSDDKPPVVTQLKNPPPPPLPGVRSKDQLLYLAQLMNIQVQFSDFPKANHEMYLTLVSLGTNPPQVCHGEGQTTEASHEKAACEALRVLSTLGLDIMSGKNAVAKDDSVPSGDPKVQANQTDVKT